MKYKISKSLIIQQNDDSLAIFDSDKSILFTLNKTAAIIFKAIKNKSTELEISKILVRKFQVLSNDAKKDVKELIQKLIKKNIIQPITRK